MRASLIVAVTAVLALAGMAPLLQTVSADHVYTHRYIVQGRVVDEDSNPIAGALVEVELDGWFPRDEGVEGPCPQERAGQRTGERTFVAQTTILGDYRFCIHSHQLSSGGRVLITVGNTTVEEEKDLAVRTTYADIVIPVGDAGEVGDVEQFNAEAGVRGRIWRPFSSDASVEGIPAQGAAIGRAPVNVTLAMPDGTTRSQSVTTNDYGEFGARFQQSGSLVGASFTVRWSTESWTLDADDRFRVSDRDFVVEDELDIDGNGAPGAGALAFVALALAAVALAAVRRRNT